MTEKKGISKGTVRTIITLVVSVHVIALIANGCDTGSVDMEGASMRQMTAINLDAARNGANTRRLANLGVTLPKWVKAKEVDSWLVCQDGLGCEDEDMFRETAGALLQPEEVCEGCNRDRNIAAIISVSAIGMYQILLWHHGKYLNDGVTTVWNEPNEKELSDEEWLENLEVIHEYLNDKSMQDKVVLGLIGNLREKYDGKPKQIASAYYSGSGTGIPLSLTWFKSWLPSAFGYGSKQHYAGIVKDCFKEKSGGRSTVDDTPEDLNIMRMCIFGKETGGAAHEFEGRDNAASLEAKWAERGITLTLKHKGQ